MLKFTTSAAIVALTLAFAPPANAGIISNIGDYLTKGWNAVMNKYVGEGSQALPSASSKPRAGGIWITQQPSKIMDYERKVRSVNGWSKVGIKHDGTRTFHHYLDPNGQKHVVEGSRAYKGNITSNGPTLSATPPEYGAIGSGGCDECH